MHPAHRLNSFPTLRSAPPNIPLAGEDGVLDLKLGFGEIASGLGRAAAVVFRENDFLGEAEELESYGFKLLLPEGEKPDRTGWKRLADMPVAMLDGDAGFRRFLAECGSEHGVDLTIGAECTSFPQAVDLAEETGWAVFVPEYWWKREKSWAARTQNLPGLEQHQRTFQLGWNRKVVERRPEVASSFSISMSTGSRLRTVK